MPTTVPILVDWWAIGPRDDNETWAAICIANGQGGPHVTEFTVAGVGSGGTFGASMLWQRHGVNGRISCTAITEAPVEIV